MTCLAVKILVRSLGKRLDSGSSPVIVVRQPNRIIENIINAMLDYVYLACVASKPEPTIFFKLYCHTDRSDFFKKNYVLYKPKFLIISRLPLQHLQF